MHKRSLEIAEKLGLLEAVASQYAALGLVYDARGDFEKAEEWHQKGLKIEKKLGRLEGIARQYGNLGWIYEQRGDDAKAREYYEKALELYKRIGMPHEVEMTQKLIGKLKG